MNKSEWIETVCYPPKHVGWYFVRRNDDDVVRIATIAKADGCVYWQPPNTSLRLPLDEYHYWCPVIFPSGGYDRTA